MGALGEEIYKRVRKLEGNKAGVITGMLLEMGQTQLLQLLQDDAAFVAKVNEAKATLESQ